jgi:protein ImuB
MAARVAGKWIWKSMKRVLCVWFPHWRREQPRTGGGRDPLAVVAGWCGPFSPLVGLVADLPPEALLLDLTGLGPLFGGEEALARRLLHTLSRRGLTTCAAIADAPGTAWALARWHALLGELPEGCRALTWGAMAEGGTPDRQGEGSAGGGAWRLVVVAPGKAAEALTPLPLAALRLPAELLATLRALGLVQIGQLLALERAALGARFGQGLLVRLDQALGRAAEVIVPCGSPPRLESRLDFETAVQQQERLKAALARQLAEVVKPLAARGQGVVALECRLRGEGHETHCLRVRLFRPGVDVQHLLELILLRLERVALSPLICSEVRLMASGPLECRQQRLFDDDPRPGPRSLARLLERLASRLGPRGVVQLSLVPDAQPERAWRAGPATDASPWWVRPSGNSGRRPRRAKKPAASGAASAADLPAAQAPAPSLFFRPLRLLQPAPVQVISLVPDGPPRTLRYQGREYRLVRTWGPERIETGWWRDSRIRRDYFRAESACGRWFWIFRSLDNGRWFLHGTFD